jgi:hypothetical protein
MQPFPILTVWGCQGEILLRVYRRSAPFTEPAGTSIVGVTRFQLKQFTVNIKELAEWFGLQIARIIVDECLPERESGRL